MQKVLSPFSSAGAGQLKQGKSIGFISLTLKDKRWVATGNPHQAVIDGLAGTARVITSAALIMVSVFCAFIINGDPNIKQFGLGMAAAVAVDATVVRCLLVPAVMSLLDRAGWWLPKWLERGLPRLSIEGEEYFAERDAAAERDAPARVPAEV